MAELLLEIGTEEIPAGFIPQALQAMKALLEKDLKDHRIPFKEIRAMGTPRRLVLSCSEISPLQEGRVSQVIGPAKRIAFDEGGKPTKAAMGFARSQGVRVEDLEIVATEKGEYIAARKEEKGEETIQILSAVLPRLILAIPFPKSMRWMDLDITFARPIHWILALFDGQGIPFQIGNITSGRLSSGHRFMAPGSFPVKDPGEYIRRLRNSFVIVNPEERRELILAELKKAAAEVSGTIIQDDDLLETVTYLVEFPVALRGNFSKEFLALPREVLISAMREHQKYFSMVNASGELLPYFVAISNTKAKDPNIVRRGNERVLQARLSDAKFFFLEDQKTPLIQKLEGLKKVVYHSKLGTSYEKVTRICALAGYLADHLHPALKETVHRAALLCKADLITGMVGEFPSLQGIMGRVYARLSSEPEAVAEAIYEHYLPTAAGGALPVSHPGAMLSIADKLDTVAGCFGVGLIPTGTADPYALRRQTLGIIHIILDRKYHLSLEALIQKSLELLKEKLQRPAKAVQGDLLEFFRGRIQNLLVSRGLSVDAVEAALTAGFMDLVDLEERAKALNDLKQEKDFEPLAIAFKRVVNISRDHLPGRVEPRLFEKEVEKNLWDAYEIIGRTAMEKISRKDYRQALRDLSALRKPVDEFFEGVFVMAEDEKIKKNRLSLLGSIARLFFKIGDFTKITTAS